MLQGATVALQLQVLQLGVANGLRTTGCAWPIPDRWSLCLMRLSPGIGVAIVCPRLSSFNLSTGQEDDVLHLVLPSLLIETLRGSSSVAMMKATNLRQGDNAAEFWWLYWPWFGRVLRQRKVSSRPVIVA